MMENTLRNPIGMISDGGVRNPIGMISDGGVRNPIGMISDGEVRNPIGMISDGEVEKETTDASNNNVKQENIDERSYNIEEIIENNCNLICGDNGGIGNKLNMKDSNNKSTMEDAVDPLDMRNNNPVTYKAAVQINNASPVVNASLIELSVGDIIKYEMRDGILCALDKQNQVVKILGNYELQVEAFVYRYDKENQERRKYRINIYVYNSIKRKSMNFKKDVEAGKVKDRKWLDDASESRINHMDSKCPDFSKYVHWLLESSEYSKIYEFEETGWREFFGKRIYLDMNGVVGGGYPNIRCLGDYCIQNSKNYSDKDNFNQVLNMINITKSIACSLPLLILTHTSVLRKLFDEAGHPVKFIMAYIGETNSKKTSIALVLTRFLREKGKNNASPSVSFEGTANGLQQALIMFTDAVQIIDDYRPSNDCQDEKELKNKLEKITRIIGDNNSVMRMTIFSNKSIPNLTPRTTCLITGEVLCTGNSSSVVRIVNVMTDREQSNDTLLTFYQENPQILGNHMYDFITYISDNYDYILTIISTKIKQLRDQYKDKFRIPRLIDSLCILQITCDILLDYAINRNFINNCEKEYFTTLFTSTLFETVKSNDSDIEEFLPEVAVVRALKRAIKKEDIRLELLTIDNVKSLKDCYLDIPIVYYDDNYYYILLDNLREIVKGYNGKQNHHSAYNDKRTLKSLLVTKKMIEVNLGSERRDQERLPCGGNYDKRRYLYLKRDVIDKIN